LSSLSLHSVAMGILDKIKSKGVGVVSAVDPDEGVAPAAPEEVRSRLLAISGKGIETAEHDNGSIVVAWRAKVTAGGLGISYRYAYRAISVDLEPDKNTAKGICISKNARAAGIALSAFGFGSADRGQLVGSETMHVVAWLGPHETEDGADEKGYHFSWGDLRHSVIGAVTGAGWTYKPKKI
jgi:hypothetical protein